MPYKEEETETVLPFRGGFRRGSWNARQRFGTVLEWGGKISEPPKIPGFWGERRLSTDNIGAPKELRSNGEKEE